jgi:hypothetical protein
MGNAVEAMKRKHLRVFAKMDIDVRLVPRDDSDAELSVSPCTARDINGGGLSFYGNVPYPEYSLLRLRIPMNDKSSQESTQDGDIINVMGKVMWSRKKKNDSKRYATGVQFLNIYESDFKLLEEFVQENIAIYG